MHRCHLAAAAMQHFAAALAAVLLQPVRLHQRELARHLAHSLLTLLAASGPCLMQLAAR